MSDAERGDRAGIGDFPILQTRDVVRGTVEAAVSLLPFGSAVSELAEVVIAPSLGKRREAWLSHVGEAVADLQENSLTLDRLADDEEWISALFEASRIAVGTHLESKLKMLQALLVRMAIEQPRSGEQVIVRRFLRFVEELDEEHFLLLRYASDPQRWFEQRSLPLPSMTMGSRGSIMDAAELGIDRPALNIIMQDLAQRELLSAGLFSGTVTEASLYDPLTTALGNELLAWVKAFE